MIEDSWEIYDLLKRVIDPELGINIVDLGLIENVEIKGDRVLVKMVLTAPGCPFVSSIVENIKQVIKTVKGVKEVEVEILDKPWSRERMSKKIKRW